MKKRAISTILVALLALSACAGCGSGTSTPSSSDAPSNPSLSESSVVSEVSVESSKAESSKQESSEESSKVESVSSKVESSKQEISKNEISIPKDIDGYKYANFDDYNSYASDNGLGNTLVYINATVDNAIEYENLSSIFAHSGSSESWMLNTGYRSIFPKADLDKLFKGKKIRCFGVYSGFSDVTKKPAILVTKIVCDNKTYYFNSDKNTSKSWKNSESVDISSLKNKCTSYTYDELARNPNKYVGKLVKLKGEVIQVMEEDLQVTLRVNITYVPFEYSDDGYYEDTVLISYQKSDEDESRILENDIVNIYGVSNGNTSYTSVLGSEVNLPIIDAFIVEISK